MEALKDVDLVIEEGEFVGIMGPSGSGKSTLLHMLALLDDPTAGKITVDGIDVLALSSIQKTSFRLNKLGYVFQEYALLPELNALENVYLPLMMLGAPARDYVKVALGDDGDRGTGQAGQAPRQPDVGWGTAARGHRPCTGQSL